MSKYVQQVKKEHYTTEGYLGNDRWGSYYWQFDLVRKISKELKKEKLEILEIGVGNKVVENLLKKFGHTVTTMDVAKDLKPDILMALPNVPSGKRYDVVLCCEVLEHMRFKDSVTSLKRLQKVATHVIVSIPDRTFYLSFSVRVPLIGMRGFVITIPFYNIPMKRGGEHYWEIGVDGISSKKILRVCKRLSYAVLQDFRVKQNPWHHFFLLKYER